MTPPMDERGKEPAVRTSGDWPGVGRRPLLKVLSAGAALSVASGVAVASDDDGNDDENQGNQPEGFEVEVIAPHATFPDDVAMAFDVTYEDGAEEAASLHDASTVVIAKVRIEPGGRSGWHSDQGPALVTVVEGEVDVTFGDECVTRTYAAGEVVTVPGTHADLLENASDNELATIFVIFLGVPDGEPPSIPVDSPVC